jgi:PAS domain S-box-containing protein
MIVDLDLDVGTDVDTDTAAGSVAAGAEGVSGATARWDWWPGSGRVRCAAADTALARATDGVASLADWIARVEPRDRARVEAGLRGCAQDGDGHWQARYRLGSPGGAPVLVEHEVFAAAPAGAAPCRVVGSVRTIGARLVAGLPGLADMLDYAADAILVRDMHHRILYWNQAAADRYGWTAAEVIGLPASDHISRGAPEEELATAMRTVMRLGDYAGRMTHRRRDGEAVAVHSHWILVRNAGGQPAFILSISTDLRERIDFEERLAQTQKLASLGGLAGGIAHDFNNLLTVILGNADELVDKLRDRGELAELALMIQSAGRRGAQLTQRLLAFARNQALRPEIFDVCAMLAAVEPLLRRILRENIVLDIECGTGNGCVFVDHGQFETSLLNLCINAGDAMPRGGELAIRATMSCVTDETAQRIGLDGGGDYLVLTVSDGGVGIPADVLPQVFDPFFTTKSGGSGLGLSMVYGFVRQSNGHLTISSETGCGTVVTIYLPRAAGVPRHLALSSAAALPIVHAVLLVEDDPALRAHVRKQLEALGNTVATAGSGEEALALLRGGLYCDVLLSDIVMPGMSGIALVREARLLHANLHVLLSTGYPLDHLDDDDKPPPGITVLHKPYGKHELQRALERGASPTPGQA